MLQPELRAKQQPKGFDEGALIPQGLAGSPNYFGFSNNLVTFINCESLKEIGEMACVTPAQCHSGFGPPPVKIR